MHYAKVLRRYEDLKKYIAQFGINSADENKSPYNSTRHKV